MIPRTEAATSAGARPPPPRRAGRLEQATTTWDIVEAVPAVGGQPRRGVLTQARGDP